jgi:hypothetical protein
MGRDVGSGGGAATWPSGWWQPGQVQARARVRVSPLRAGRARGSGTGTCTVDALRCCAHEAGPDAGTSAEAVDGVEGMAPHRNNGIQNCDRRRQNVPSSPSLSATSVFTPIAEV